MARSVWPSILSLSLVLELSGCGWIEREQRPAWRTQAENYCLAQGYVKASASLRPMPEIDGPGICGLTHPFKVSALVDGAVAIDKPVTIDCPMIPALEAWLNDTVQPAARARFGQPVVALDAFGAYSCRSVDNLANTKLSEHAFGNAIDVAGFRLADGRDIVIVRDWKKTDTQESAFLHEAHAGACQQFTTVLGPGADVFHYNHFHLDLAMHGKTNTGLRRYCKPFPAPNLLPPPAAPDGLPPAPDLEEPMDVAQAKRPRMPVFAQAPMALHGPDGALPPAPLAYEPEAPPPILPEEGIDGSPTSATALSHDE